MVYRAAPITQRDGSQLQNSNCLMAAAATGIDFHTLGSITSTGDEMRDYSGDTSGGTNSDEIDRAWHRGWDEDAAIRDGRPWDDVLDDLHAGRLVMLQVWHATTGGPCLSGSGAYGHGLAVAPEYRRDSDGTHQWLVSDPWCKPPKWVWWDQSKLRAGAEKWASKIAYAVGGDPRHTHRDVLEAAVRMLMRRWHPGRPAPADQEPPELDVGGPPGCLFASSAPHVEDARGDDVAINCSGSDPQTKRRVDLIDDAGFYADSDFTVKYGAIDRGTTLHLLGPGIGTDAYAVIWSTDVPYDDGDARPTVVYVAKRNCSDPYAVETPAPDPDPAARDALWRSWIADDPHAPDRQDS